jgi:isocitrate dehydrogenase kinase/phosphatase
MAQKTSFFNAIFRGVLERQKVGPITAKAFKTQYDQRFQTSTQP